jgi:transposase
MSKALFVRELTPQEQRELQRLIRRGRDARVVRRAQMIWLSSQGQTAQQIATTWRMAASGIRKIIIRFNSGGIGALSDRPHQGRPRKAHDAYIELLKKAVGTNPRDLGYPFTCWTLERLREHLARQTRVLLSLPRLSGLMAENHIVYRRPKHGMEHLRDPKEYNEKQAFLEFIKRGPVNLSPDSNSSTSMSVRFISTRP